METYIIDINYYFSKPLYTIRWKYISKVGRYFPTTFNLKFNIHKKYWSMIQ